MTTSAWKHGPWRPTPRAIGLALALAAIVGLLSGVMPWDGVRL